VLRESKYVCTICLNPVADGALRAFSPCGHCFCAACVNAHGVVLTSTTPFETYEGQCPMCRAEVDDVLTLYL